METLEGKKQFQLLANKFLIETEESDKKKPGYMTKNHVPTLHNSLNEFYLWLEVNYWKNLKKQS